MGVWSSGARLGIDLYSFFKVLLEPAPSPSGVRSTLRRHPDATKTPPYGFIFSSHLWAMACAISFGHPLRANAARKAAAQGAGADGSRSSYGDRWGRRLRPTRNLTSAVYRTCGGCCDANGLGTGNGECYAIAGMPWGCLGGVQKNL